MEPAGFDPLTVHDPESIVRAQNLYGLAASFLLSDQMTQEAVRVQITPNGNAGVVGDGALLNWFCDQIPHFRGLLGESLPDGRPFYIRIRDAEDERFGVSFPRGNPCHAAPDILR